MEPSKLGIEQLNERVVLTASGGGILNDGMLDIQPLAGGWGMAQYQYGFEGTYLHRTPVVPSTVLKGEDPESSPIVFVGGYGAASYQYANETTYGNAASVELNFAHLVQKPSEAQEGTSNGGIWKTTNFDV